jgi:serine/threonine protein kinase
MPNESFDATVLTLFTRGSEGDNRKVADIDLPKEFHDRYRMLAFLGAGAMGAVYLAEDRVSGLQVAIKVLAKRGDPELVERFMRECAVLERVEHPHVLNILTHRTLSGFPCLISEYLPGGNLRARMQATGKFPVSAANAVMLEVLDGLDACHSRGIVHRDLKPENILLSASGAAKLADFGLARDFGAAGETLTMVGTVLGTPRYMSPEQLAGEQCFEGGDVFAAGVIHYELLTGEPPFVGHTQSELLAAVVAQRRKPVQASNGTVPESLAALVHRAILPDAARRPANAGEYRDAILGLAKPRRAGSHNVPMIRPAPPPKRNWSLPLAALLLVSAFVFWSRTGSLGPSPTRQEPVKSSPAGARIFVPILGLSVRPLEREVHVAFHTPRSIAVEVAGIDTSGGGRAVRADARPGYIHHGVLRGLEPGHRYRVTLAARDPAVTVQFEALTVTTEEKNSRESHMNVSSGGSLVSEEGALDARAPLRWLADDRDLPLAVELLKNTSSREDINLGCKILEELADPTMVEPLVKWIHAQDTRLQKGEGLRNAIRVLAATGGTRAADELAALSRGAMSWAEPDQIYMERRQWIRADAARALAQVDPERAEHLFSGMLSSDRDRSIALDGAERLEAPWAEELIDRLVCQPSVAGEWFSYNSALCTILLRGTPRFAEALAHLTHRGELVESLAWRLRLGLATWGDGSSMDALLRWLGEPIHVPPRKVVHPQEIWMRRALTMLAVGRIAARNSDAAIRGRGRAALGGVLELGDPVLRRIALRLLAVMGDPQDLAKIEQAYRRKAVPRQEFALVLARLGSPLAAVAIDALAQTRKTTDLWVAGVAAALLPPADRERLLAKIDGLVKEVANPRRRALLRAELDWLKTSNPAELVWLDPSDTWLPTGLDLRRGDRFRIVCHGVTANRVTPSPGDGKTFLPPDTEGPDDGPLVDARGARIINLQLEHSWTETWSDGACARVGLWNLPLPLDPQAEHISQEEGPLLVRIAHLGMGEPYNMGWQFTKAGPVPFCYSGLLLLKVWRMP